MDFSYLLREEKCNSLVYLCNKITKLRFFNLWLNKYTKMNENSDEIKFNSLILSYFNKKKLRKYFHTWRYLIKDQSLTETRLSSMNSNINENDSRYQEFYHDLQELSLKNAELETKRTALDDRIEEINSLIEQIGSIYQQKKDKLTISASRNEILLRQLAETKLQRRNEIVNMRVKLSDAQRNQLSLSQMQNKQDSTLSREETFSIVQNAQDSYNAKINGIKVRLKCYKDEAIKIRSTYQQTQQQNNKLEKEIQQLEKKVQKKESEVDALDNKVIVEPEFDQDTKDLLNDIRNQLQITRDAILANEVKITKNISQIRTLKMRIMQNDYS